MANLATMQGWLTLLTQGELTLNQVTNLINMADREECENYQWARLKEEITVNSFAAQAAIPVTVTQGSPTVTRNSSTFPAVTAQYVLTISGQAFAPIPVVANASASATITLVTPYPAASSGSATASLFPLWYSAVGFQQVFGVRQQAVLTQTTHEELNIDDPSRAQQASPAQQWAPGGRDVTDNAQFELWPIETAANAYVVYGLRGHVDMAQPTDLPAVPSDVVTASACIKACEAIYALRGDPRWAQLQATYQKKYDIALERSKLTDAEQFGVIATLADKYRNIGPGGARGASLIFQRGQ